MAVLLIVVVVVIFVGRCHGRRRRDRLAMAAAMGERPGMDRNDGREWPRPAITSETAIKSAGTADDDHDEDYDQEDGNGERPRTTTTKTTKKVTANAHGRGGRLRRRSRPAAERGTRSPLGGDGPTVA